MHDAAMMYRHSAAYKMFWGCAALHNAVLKLAVLLVLLLGFVMLTYSNLRRATRKEVPDCTVKAFLPCYATLESLDTLFVVKRTCNATVQTIGYLRLQLKGSAQSWMCPTTQRQPSGCTKCASSP